MSGKTPVATTFLFTDIVESVWQWETSPDMGCRVDRHLRLLHLEVDRHRGEVFSVMGDGVAAAFPSAAAAVHAAIGAQLAMPALGLDVRMGMHTGALIQTDGDFRGPPVNRAARIMALAHGGQILVSDTTAQHAVSDLGEAQLRPLGVHHLRGLLDPDRLWAVLHPGLRQDFPPRSEVLRSGDRRRDHSWASADVRST